jgi:cell wall-associated NlpC family hydrolase
MSISAVESRISQIVAMQQQLSDPSALLSSQASSAASTASGGTSAGSTSFSDALSSALASGTADAIGTDPTADQYSDPTMDSSLTSADPSSELSSLLATAGGVTGTSGAATGVATAGSAADAPAQVQAMTNMANSLVGKPYVYGGGHSGWGPQAGYDCSGFVSAVLHAGGYLSQPVDTTALPSQAGMEPGPGQYVTVYDRALPGQSGHVIIEINGQFYESGGSHGSWGGGGGVEKIGTPSAAYLAQFPNVLHPAGL